MKLDPNRSVTSLPPSFPRPEDPPAPDAVSGASPAHDEVKVEHRGGVLSSLSDVVARARTALGDGAEHVVDGIAGLGRRIGHEIDAAVGEVKGAYEAIREGGPIAQIATKAAMGVVYEPFKTREVVDDPSDVNQATPDAEATATRELRAHGEEAGWALSRWSKGDREAYLAIAGTLTEHPLAERALQAMLLDGRLPGAQDLKGQGTLLADLKALSKQDLAPGVDRSQLMNDVVREVENPVRIAQHDRLTCGATTAQILLTRKHPAEYVRLIEGLASPEGTVKAIGGATVARKSDWQADDGGRSVSSRLLQPALMQLGQTLGPFEKYHNTDDVGTVGPVKDPLSDGLLGFGAARIDSQIMGVAYENHTLFRGRRTEGWDALKQALDAGKGPIPVDLTWGDSGHFVQVDRIADGEVHYTNPWGQMEKMSQDEFLAHLMEVQIPH